MSAPWQPRRLWLRQLLRFAASSAIFGDRLPHLVMTRNGCRRMRLAQILELLETVVLLTGSTTRRRCASNGLIGLLERQEFDAARSNEAADGNAVATFVPQVGGHSVCEGRERGGWKWVPDNR